jgi:hypothetical protein
MGYAVIKVDRDTDRYIIWHSITDSPAYWGTANEIRMFYREKFGTSGSWDCERSLERADEFGSSSYMERGLWDSKTLRYGGDKEIERSKLGALYDRMEAWAMRDDTGHEPEVDDLLTEIKWED